MNLWEIHPAVIHFPIAFLIGGVVLDLFGHRKESLVRAATYLILAGIAAAVVAIATGFLAFYTVPKNHTQHAHDWIMYHLYANLTAAVLFVIVGIARWRRPAAVSPIVRVLGMVAVLVLSVGAYIGGDVVYHGGMGIDEAILKPGLRPGAEKS
nr:hypothetical protein Hi04_10k_c4998_00013 [uncultured bacterium]